MNVLKMINWSPSSFFRHNCRKQLWKRAQKVLIEFCQNYLLCFTANGSRRRKVNINANKARKRRLVIFSWKTNLWHIQEAFFTKPLIFQLIRFSSSVVCLPRLSVPPPPLLLPLPLHLFKLNFIGPSKSYKLSVWVPSYWSFKAYRNCSQSVSQSVSL